jgi:hypothetical protein
MIKRFLLAFLMVATLYGATQTESIVHAEESIESLNTKSVSSVESLRGASGSNGWSIVAYGDAASVVESSTETNYTYYTDQQWNGYKYAFNENTFAFVPKAMEYTVPETYLEVPVEILASQEYSVVLKNDGTNDMALVYIAEEAGTLYYQDLVQVAPLHFDKREEAGIYGEYRILLESAGNTTQVYPAEGTHKLEAENAAPTTSAWVNDSVEVKAGDKLIFRSDKAESTVFVAPVVSYVEFEEVYDLHNFWKFQQINDANYFEAVYRHTDTDSWNRFLNLETKKGELDIPQRADVYYRSSFYWTGDYNYMGVFGGLYVHASGETGKGDVAYAFHVPKTGFVNVDLTLVGNWASGDFEIVYDGKVLDSCTSLGDTIFRNGHTLSSNYVMVTAGTEIYFVQKSLSGGSLKADMNPIITYVDAPYSLDATSLELSKKEEKTLTLSVEEGFASDAEITWSVLTEGVVELVADGKSVTIKGLSDGQTVVQVQIGDYAPLTCNVEVKTVLQHEFTVSANSLEVEEGKNGELTLTVNENFTLEGIEVMMEDDSIATATVSGNKITVTGVKKGSTKLYISTEGSKGLTVDVLVKEAQQPEQPETPEQPKEESNGWVGVLVGSLIVIAILCGTVLFIRKRKKD